MDPIVDPYLMVRHDNQLLGIQVLRYEGKGEALEVVHVNLYKENVSQMNDHFFL